MPVRPAILANPLPPLGRPPPLWVNPLPLEPPVARLLTALLAAVLAVTLLTAAPAAAKTTSGPRVDQIIYARNDPTPRVLNIHIQGARHTYGFTKRARILVRRLRHHGGHPRIYVHSKGRCRPGRFCITVKRVHRPNTWWGAQTRAHSTGATVLINMPRRPRCHQWLAAHEFVHTLGMYRHHRANGIMAYPYQQCNWLSRREARTLRKAYARRY